MINLKNDHSIILHILKPLLVGGNIMKYLLLHCTKQSKDIRAMDGECGLRVD